MVNTNGTINTDTIAMVKEFMVTGEQTVREYAQYAIPERRLRANLVWEEVEENVLDGFRKKDLVEVIDACADIVYVAVGGALAHGYPMTVRKTPDFELASFDNLAVQDNFIVRLRTLMGELLVRSLHAPTSAEEEAKSYEDVDSQRAIVDLWEKMVELCYEISLTYGVDLDVIINEVQDSNMSKFRDKDGNFIILRDGNGKIMKAGGYFKPRVVELLASMGIEKNSEV